jgi:glycosyltransferase involved in cell wall biosynthesis
METRIAVVTPSYNQGKFIERTIRSVLSQNVGGLEYIVMDGGSTDKTLSVLKRHQDQLSWLSERDKGPADAINKGFYCSTAPILGWLNSDDIYYPGCLETILEFLNKNPEVDVVYGDAWHIDENDAILEKYPTEDWDWKRLQQNCIISQPAAFFRRRVIERFGPLNTRFRCMDYEYWLRIGKAGARFVHLPKILAATRLHKEAFTVAGRLEVHYEVNSITRERLGRTPDCWLMHYAHAVSDAMGLYGRHHNAHRLMFPFLSVYAALRWNGSISQEMWEKVRGLIMVWPETIYRIMHAGKRSP